MVQFDIVVVGGGVAGLCAAQALAQTSQHLKKPWRIALIETREIQTPSELLDARTLALSFDSAQTLAKYQLWPMLAPYTTRIEDIFANAQHGFAQTHLSAKDHHLEAFGYVIPLAQLQQQLHATCLNHEQITFFCPDTPCHLQTKQSGIELQLNSGVHLQADLLIAADGQPSWVGQQSGIEWKTRAFNQHAVLTQVDLQASIGSQAFERFTTQGPMALLPLPDQRAALVWCVPPSCAQELLTCTPTEFLQQAQMHFGRWAGSFVGIGKRTVYPLELIYSDYPIAHRCVLIANAAQQLHPVAGQGFNLGMRDIRMLVESLETHAQQNIPIGHFQQLHAYWQSRKADQQMMTQLTTLLVDLFSNPARALHLCGQLGLGLTQMCTTLEHALIGPLLGKGYQHVLR